MQIQNDTQKNLYPQLHKQNLKNKNYCSEVNFKQDYRTQIDSFRKMIDAITQAEPAIVDALDYKPYINALYKIAEAMRLKNKQLP